MLGLTTLSDALAPSLEIFKSCVQHCTLFYWALTHWRAWQQSHVLVIKYPQCRSLLFFQSNQKCLLEKAVHKHHLAYERGFKWQHFFMIGLFFVKMLIKHKNTSDGLMKTTLLLLAVIMIPSWKVIASVDLHCWASQRVALLNKLVIKWIVIDKVPSAMVGDILDDCCSLTWWHCFSTN